MSIQILILTFIQSILICVQICGLIYVIAGWFDDPDFENVYAKIIIEAGGRVLQPFHRITSWLDLPPRTTITIFVIMIWFINTLVSTVIDANL